MSGTSVENPASVPVIEVPALPDDEYGTPTLPLGDAP